MDVSTAPTAPTPRRRMAIAAAAAAALGLIVASHLLWSSPFWRRSWLLAAAVIALLVLTRSAWPHWRATGRAGALALAGLLVAHGAAWLGGLQQGGGLAEVTLAMARGLAAVAGIAVLAAVLPAPAWRRPLRWTGLGVLISVLAGSLAGYFLILENHVDLGRNAFWYDPMRLAAIWPTRLLTASWGQVVWQHANVAGYYFALAMVLVLERNALMSRAARPTAWPWWLLVMLLAAAVYLTASRGAGLMVMLALPLILGGRPWKFAALALALTVAGILAGHAGLHAKQRIVLNAALSGPAAETKVLEAFRLARTTDHAANYLKRADAGRFTIYQELWRETQDSRWFGNGLAAADKPVLYLNQEHSSFFATLRTSGLAGCLGHLLVLSAAGWGAMRAFLRGTRWPAVLLVAAMAGILFDRTTVLALTGYYEFLAHWTAIALALLAGAAKPAAA